MHCPPKHFQLMTVNYEFCTHTKQEKLNQITGKVEIFPEARGKIRTFYSRTTRKQGLLQLLEIGANFSNAEHIAQTPNTRKFHSISNLKYVSCFSAHITTCAESQDIRTRENIHCYAMAQ
jgi:hypothetical protein